MSCIYGSDYCEECPVIKLMVDLEGKLDFHALGRFCLVCPILHNEVPFVLKMKWRPEDEEKPEE